MIKTRIQRARLYLSTYPTTILAILLLSLAVTGLSCVVICIYVSWPIGDDFGAIAFYRPDAWLPHTVNSLMNTGRYGQSLFGALIYGLFRSKTSNILPLITLFWFIALTYLYIREFLDKKLRAAKNSRPLAAVLTVLLSFLTIFVNNSVENANPPTWFTYQTFFWPSGIITYTLPLLFLLTALYLVFVRKNGFSNRQRVIFLATTVFLTGLFNETQPVTILFISLALLCLSFIRPLKTYRTYYLITAVFSFLSLVALYLSPGSQKRQAATGVFHRGNISNGVIQDFWTSISHLMFRPRELILIAITGFLIAIIFRQRFSKIIINRRASYGGILVGTLLLVFTLGSLLCSLTLLCIGYGEHTGIYARTLLITQLCYVLSLVVLATSISSLLINGMKKPGIGTLTCFAVLAFLILLPGYLDKIVSQLNSSMGYANAWISEEPIIEADKYEKKQPVIYLPPSTAGIGDGFSLSCTGPYAGSTDWLNQAIEQYYGVRKVCSTQDKPLPVSKAGS